MHKTTKTGLEGIFTEVPTIKQTEQDILSQVINDTNYKSEDIVAVAFASNHPIQGLKFHEFYLTERGFREMATHPLHASYKKIVGIVTKTGNFNADPQDFPKVADRLKDLPSISPQYDELGGEGSKRVCVTYVRDITAESF